MFFAYYHSERVKKLTSEDFRSNPLFLRNQFESEGIFGMPIIRRQNIDLKDIKLIGYDQTKPNDKANMQSFVHFFLDDYKFEVIWNDPEPRLGKLSQYKGVLSPPFSTFYTSQAIIIRTCFFSADLRTACVKITRNAASITAYFALSEHKSDTKKIFDPKVMGFRWILDDEDGGLLA